MAARRTATWSCRPRCKRCSAPGWISWSAPSGAFWSGRSRGRDLPPRRRSSAHPRRYHVTPRLAALVRKQLIRPERPELAGEDAFRFRHLLIRDAAYDSLPKAARADLHLRFADWMGQRGRGSGRAGRDPRLPPRAGAPLPGRARATARRSRLRGGGPTPERIRPSGGRAGGQSGGCWPPSTSSRRATAGSR